MDAFVDKIAQRFTAQEIIKANTVAEMEELVELKHKTKEYAECLEKMQAMVDAGIDKFQGMENQNAAKIEDLKKVLKQLEQLNQIEELKASIQALEASLDSGITEKLESAKDYMHKESVKVYRNVQAVIVEENEKQTNVIVESNKSIKKKTTAAVVFSVLAFLMAAAGLCFQILVYLQIL